MAKHHGHIRPEVRRLVLEAIATVGTPQAVTQIDNQMKSALESERLN